MTSTPQRQPDPPTPVLFCWSGGKNSALGLHAHDRISMHGVRRAWLLEQAEALGLPLSEVRIPSKCGNSVCESRMEQALRAQIAAGVNTVAFGDIFLQDPRQHREPNLAHTRHACHLSHLEARYPNSASSSLPHPFYVSRS